MHNYREIERNKFKVQQQEKRPRFVILNSCSNLTSPATFRGRHTSLTMCGSVVSVQCFVWQAFTQFSYEIQRS